MAKAKYTVNSPIQILRKRIEPGSVVELDDADAEGLLASGSIVKAGKQAEPKQPETKDGETKDGAAA